MKIRNLFEIAWEALVLSIIIMSIGVVIGIVIYDHFRSESLTDTIKIIISLVIGGGIIVIFCSIIMTIRIKAIAKRFNLDGINNENFIDHTVESERVKRSPTPQERDNVMKLYKKGWTAEEISEAMNLSKGEVELIIEITG